MNMQETVELLLTMELVFEKKRKEGEGSGPSLFI
jgi:hypothetical protein